MEDRFNEYYCKYLGINGNNNLEELQIIVSENREEKINDYMYYPIIVANYNEKKVISTTRNYYKELKDEVQKNIKENDLNIIIQKFLENKFINYKMKEMYRMSLDYNKSIDISNVIKIDDKCKKYFYNSIKKDTSLENKERKWNQLKKYIDLRVMFWNIR